MPIVIPTLSEARTLMGTEKILGFTAEFLADQRTLELVKELEDRTRGIDDRFDAALALRSRNLNEEGQVGAQVITRLFRHVQEIAAPAQTDGRMRYTMEDKRTGLMSVVALQGSIFGSAHRETVLAWLREGAVAMERERDVQYLQRHYAESGAKGPADLDKVTPESIAREAAANKAHKAAMLCGATTDSEVINALTSTLRHRHIDDSYKVFAITALTGVTDQIVGDTFCLVMQDRYCSPLILHSLLAAIGTLRPSSEALLTALKAFDEVLEKAGREAQIELDDINAEEIADFHGMIKQALSPRYQHEEAEVVRTRFGAELLRPLVHLKDHGSLLFPSERFANVIHEIAPSGTNGDLLTWEPIRSGN